ncbi:hypothetical protein TNCV_4805421 [Trichonephila clavipes]|nr:hypothetical protein TNCV_4805421 [Trichonephila clavipes]
MVVNLLLPLKTRFVEEMVHVKSVMTQNPHVGMWVVPSWMSFSLLNRCSKLREVGNINATRNCDALSKLKEAIWKKRPGFLKSFVLLLDDNARPHSVTTTQNHIQILG